MFVAKFLENLDSYGGFTRFEQVRLRGKVWAGRLQIEKSCDLGFTDKPAGENSGIGRGWQREATIADGQPKIVHGHRRVKKPGGPEFPARPSSDCGSDASP